MRVVFCLVLIVIICAACVNASAKGNNSFTFVQIADTQLGMSTDDKDLTPDLIKFSKAVDYINRKKPAFVVISGDLVNKPHDPKQIRAFWNVAHEINPSIPLYLVPGNHDIGQPDIDDIKSYSKLFGPDHYSFSYANSEFIVLDSNLIHDSDADKNLCSDQKKWFEEQLKEARAKNPAHIFVLTHHPWFIKTPDEADNYYVIPAAVRQDYLNLMKQYGVEYMIAGHYHRNAVIKGNGFEMITTAAIGKPFEKDVSGFRVFKVYSDKVEQYYIQLDQIGKKSSH